MKAFVYIERKPEKRGKKGESINFTKMLPKILNMSRFDAPNYYFT